ncbi:MAG TPA: plasmid mobilization relaxosome protein MobC [Thermoanaerobaculia bacterium]
MARIKLLSVRLSAGEFLRVCLAADTSAMSPASWIRHQALRAAEGTFAPPGGLRLPPPASPAPNLTHIATTRFTEEQFEALVDYARACGLPLAAFLRQVVLGVKPIARRPELRSAIVAVNRVGNNLNQLVKLAHTGVVLAPELARVVREVLVELHALQKALLRADAGDAGEPSA